MAQKIIGTGSRRVAIYSQGDGGPFDSRLYVNCTAPRHENDASALGDATLVKRKHATLSGAINWAADELARAEG